MLLLLLLLLLLQTIMQSAIISSIRRYDVALTHASIPEHRMTILRAQADHYYSLKKFELAASLCATPAP